MQRHKKIRPRNLHSLNSRSTHSSLHENRKYSREREGSLGSTKQWSGIQMRARKSWQFVILTGMNCPSVSGRRRFELQAALGQSACGFVRSVDVKVACLDTILRERLSATTINKWSSGGLNFLLYNTLWNAC